MLNKLGLTIICFSFFVILAQKREGFKESEQFISYTIDSKSQDLQLFWKNDSNQIFGSIANLKDWLELNKKELLFATNGGMYKGDRSPQGLFIQNFKCLNPIDTNKKGFGNFYLSPNGIFYINSHKQAYICKTHDFKMDGQIAYATQSGPMLVIDGVINPAFKKGSKNLNIRNGVGILPNGKTVFAMSQNPINFYDFASYFKSLGCRNALYLDGFVSRTYLPEKNWIQTDGNFGVIIGVLGK